MSIGSLRPVVKHRSGLALRAFPTLFRKRPAPRPLPPPCPNCDSLRVWVGDADAIACPICHDQTPREAPVRCRCGCPMEVSFASGCEPEPYCPECDTAPTF